MHIDAYGNYRVVKLEPKPDSLVAAVATINDFCFDNEVELVQIYENQDGLYIIVAEPVAFEERYPEFYHSLQRWLGYLVGGTIVGFVTAVMISHYW